MRKKSLKSMSIAELERALAGLKAEEADFLRQRVEIDKRLATIRGSAKVGRKLGPRVGPSLIQCVVETLAASLKPLGVKDIAQKVLGRGYKTTSKNVHALIWAQIYKDDRIVRPERGRFTIKDGVEVKAFATDEVITAKAA